MSRLSSSSLIAAATIPSNTILPCIMIQVHLSFPFTFTQRGCLMHCLIRTAEKEKEEKQQSECSVRDNDRPEVGDGW
jgi:hypothetical protein